MIFFHTWWIRHWFGFPFFIYQRGAVCQERGTRVPHWAQLLCCGKGVKDKGKLKVEDLVQSGVPQVDGGEVPYVFVCSWCDVVHGAGYQGLQAVVLDQVFKEEKHLGRLGQVFRTITKSSEELCQVIIDLGGEVKSKSNVMFSFWNEAKDLTIIEAYKCIGLYRWYGKGRPWSVGVSWCLLSLKVFSCMIRQQKIVLDTKNGLSFPAFQKRHFPVQQT